MYARYVLPSKSPKTATPATNVPAIGRGSSPLPTRDNAAPVPTNGFGYARYVPKAKASIHIFEEPVEESPGAKRKRDAADGAAKEQKAEKKSRREEKHERSSSPEAQTETERDPESESAKKDSRRVKKEKKKAKKKEKKRQKASKDNDVEMTNGVEEDIDRQNRTTGATKRSGRTDEDSEDEEAEEAVTSKQKEAVEEVPSSKPPTEEAVGKADEKKRKKEKRKKRERPSSTDDDKTAKDDEDKPQHKAVLERKLKSLKLATDNVAPAEEGDAFAEVADSHGLEPLPQPKPAPLDASAPSYETLPSWLAEPIRVSQETRTPFANLGILPKAARVLEEKGFMDAFAVQTAALPLLLPSIEHKPGDLLVSAATGSGKTLAYALPIVRDISQGVVMRLRALIVLPTRELVRQAQEVFELCAKAYEGGDRKRVRIGLAIGSQMLKHEQSQLMDRESRYDPETYSRILEESRSQDQDETELEDPDATDPRLGTWEGEVVEFMSKVDVLICTPGRLVEHLEQTPGFSLDYVRWLVVDEADKILAQAFQGWLELALEKFQTNEFGARDFPGMNYSGVRKIILSATLTRDLSLLSQLNLRRPRLVVLESGGDTRVADHTLPELLREFAIRVHDANLKPLYLLDLLQGSHMEGPSALDDKVKPTDVQSSASDTSSESSSDSDTSDDSSSDSDSATEDVPATSSKTRDLPRSLIFTKSNESAIRLSRLLTLLDSSLEPYITTITSTTPTHIRRKTLRAFSTPSSPLRLIIASDLVARGIDIPSLDNVINYDLPASVAGYVHRVGRTARAGRAGSAWTLVGDDESGWFWGKIAKGAGVRRAQKVERVRIEEMGEESVQRYEDALGRLGREAVEFRKR